MNTASAEQDRTQSSATNWRIAVTGATGYIGTALVDSLRRQGHRVQRISRSRPEPGSGDIQWNPVEGLLRAQDLEGVDAVVHLAGESIARPWTAKQKERIRNSRVVGTTLLAKTIASLERPPRVLVSASGVHYYGDRGDEVLTEESGPGEGFLAEVVREWEAATEPAAQRGIRVVNTRNGIVLGPGGGILQIMLIPFRLGLGGKLGSGKQWTSWVALEDTVRIIEFALANESLRGPINAVAPNPVTNAELTRTLGRVLNRPTLFAAPAAALRLVAGQMAEELLLMGQRAVPKRLLETGFRFQQPDLEGTLREATRDAALAPRVHQHQVRAAVPGQVRELGDRHPTGLHLENPCAVRGIMYPAAGERLVDTQCAPVILQAAEDHASEDVDQPAAIHRCARAPVTWIAEHDVVPAPALPDGTVSAAPPLFGAPPLPMDWVPPAPGSAERRTLALRAARCSPRSILVTARLRDRYRSPARVDLLTPHYQGRSPLPPPRAPLPGLSIRSGRQTECDYGCGNQRPQKRPAHVTTPVTNRGQLLPAGGPRNSKVHVATPGREKGRKLGHAWIFLHRGNNIPLANLFPLLPACPCALYCNCSSHANLWLLLAAMVANLYSAEKVVGPGGSGQLGRCMGVEYGCLCCGTTSTVVASPE